MVDDVKPKIDCVKKKKKSGVFSNPYFSAFGLNTYIYRVNLHVQSKCSKRRTRKNSGFGHFLRRDSMTRTKILPKQSEICCRLSIIIISLTDICKKY